MELFDIKEVQEQFNKVLAYSQEGLEEPKTDELFRRWKEAKRDFITALGGNLIYEISEDVTFELDEESKNIKRNDFFQLILDKYKYNDLYFFLIANEDGFYSNQVVNTYIYRPDEHEEIRIPAGMKLVKAFKYFINDTFLLNEVQSAASMIIQENKITGRFCISVHPLDFLSSSENTHNWRSCHALDGEYRSGNLSYMLDKTTFMCYLKSKNEVILPDFPEDVPWNSKKWRVLMFLSEDWKLIFAGRQYPFTSNSGLDYALSIIKSKILRLSYFTPWMRTDRMVGMPEEIYNPAHPADKLTISTKKLVNVKGGMIPIQMIVHDAEGALHYNDLLSSTCYEPLYSAEGNRYEDRAGIIHWDTLPYTRQIPKLKVGGTCNCLRCNSSPITLTESFLCVDCDMRYGAAEADIYATCPFCEERFIYDDGYWIEDEDIMICPWCGENEVGSCEFCGSLTRNTMVTDDDDTVYACLYCQQ